VILKMKPMLAIKFDIPVLNALDWKVIVGPTIFGIGWGISGFCPGPGMINLFLNINTLIFVIFLAAGQLLIGKVVDPLLAQISIKKNT